MTQSRGYAALADGTGGTHMCFRLKSLVPNAQEVRHHLHLCWVCFVGRSCGVNLSEGGATSLILLHSHFQFALNHKLKKLIDQFDVLHASECLREPVSEKKNIINVHFLS